MTHRTNEAPRREVIARWCTLAEQRLNYLTEMFESGRWRRFYTEVAFLENIKEAKSAVETWRSLSTPDQARSRPPIEWAVPAQVAKSDLVPIAPEAFKLEDQ